MPVQMFDTITVSTVPSNPQAVAGYVGGFWPTYDALVWKFPQARHVSIAVNAGEDAQCLDIERGDAVPSQAPAWVKRQQARGISTPILYCSLSAATEVLRVLQQAGIPRDAVRLWTAHYTYRRHLCSPSCGAGFEDLADATQFSDHALGRNLDESVCADSFFPAPSDPHHYDRYAPEPFAFGKLQLNERATVEEYDRLFANRKNHRGRINVLRSHIKLLRDRIWTVAHWEQPANWGSCHRGWRWQRLNERLSGAVKLDY